MFDSISEFLAFIIHNKTELAEIVAHFEDGFISEIEAGNKIQALLTTWNADRDEPA